MRGRFNPIYLPSQRGELRLLVIVLLLLLVLPACSSSRLKMNAGLINRLKDRGPVALSSDNPYLAGNLLVSREMANSAELKGFIQHRGAPSAVEVTQSFFGPLMMAFYYPEAREQYELEYADSTWIIKGPQPIERERMKLVAALTRNAQGEPRLASQAIDNDEPLSESTTRLPASTSSGQSSHGASQRKVETGEEPTYLKKQPLLEEDPVLAKLDANAEAIMPKAKSAFRSPVEPSSPVDPRRPIARATSQEDRQFIVGLVASIGRHPAEMTPKGDLVHYVTYPGETLSMIARWYTLDQSNAGKLARINNLPNANALVLGDQIVIPSYLVKNKVILTEDAVRALAERAY